MMAPKTWESSRLRIARRTQPGASSPKGRSQERSFLAAALVFLLITTGPAKSGAEAGSSNTTYLADGWSIQSSAKIQEQGQTISSPAFKPVDWYKAAVPSTVAGTLVDDGVYPDPFFGMNLRSFPGMEYPVGTNFSGKPMPANSPFKVSWWYRREFRVTPDPGGQVWLNFDGINYRANLWLNGKLIADTNRVAGDVSHLHVQRHQRHRASAAERAGGRGVPARCEQPRPHVGGLEPDASGQEHGIVARCFRHHNRSGRPAISAGGVQGRPAVAGSGASQRLSRARECQRTAAQGHAQRQDRRPSRFEQTVDLAAHQRRRVEFTPDHFAQLNLSKPRLWWPVHAGPQNLYDLNLEVSVDGKTSDHDLIRFGIREATSQLNDKGYRVFKINGRPILVRGGGWAPDMFLRPSPEREAAQIRYVKDMNLNAIRFEGKTERGRFLEMCDREGIMVIAGWCCCDFWEHWSQWKDNDYDIATESLRDQIRRIRNHPCLITYWYGSDGPPNARAERNYLAVLKELNWPNSVPGFRHGQEARGGRPDRDPDDRPVRVRPARVLVRGHERRRRVLLQHRDQPRSRRAADREPAAHVAQGTSLADRRLLELSRGRRTVPQPGYLHGSPEQAARPGEERRGLRDEGAGHGV